MLQNAKLPERRLLSSLYLKTGFKQKHIMQEVSKHPIPSKSVGNLTSNLTNQTKFSTFFWLEPMLKRGNIITHEYCKCILMTFLFITYKNTLKQVRV